MILSKTVRSILIKKREIDPEIYGHLSGLAAETNNKMKRPKLVVVIALFISIISALILIFFRVKSTNLLAFVILMMVCLNELDAMFYLLKKLH